MHVAVKITMMLSVRNCMVSESSSKLPTELTVARYNDDVFGKHSDDQIAKITDRWCLYKRTAFPNYDQ